MRKSILLLIIVITPYLSLYPCTTFVLQTKNGLYFGRNLDWVSDLGLIVVNQKNVSKESLVFGVEKSIKWISKYGSISFNQFGKEFPFGGINEKGLVIEIMVSQAEYPEPDERPMVNELQWVQYQLDNCATVEEVIQTDSILRIGQAHENLHYLICDGDGKTVVIEFIKGKMVFYRNKELPVAVLENDDYKASLEALSEEKQCRFTKAVNLIKTYKGNGGQSAIDYSFKILEEVALSAEWSIVYDINKKEIHFSTSSHRDLRKINMNVFDFNCSNQTLSYDLMADDTGEVSHKFSKLKSDANGEILKKAMELNAVPLETEQINQVVNYFKQSKCIN